MKKFEIVSYNYSNQQIEVQINYPVKQGMLVLKDIDLDTEHFAAWAVDKEAWRSFRLDTVIGWTVGNVR